MSLHFVAINPERLINVALVTEVRLNQFDCKDQPCAKVYFTGSNGDTRDNTTVTPEEGERIKHHALIYSEPR